MAARTEIYVDPSKQTRTAVTITNVTTTATVTLNSHGYSNSDTVKIQGATEGEYNGYFVISNVTTNTFDYTMATIPLGAATGSPLCSKMNLAGDDGTTDALAWADLQYALDTDTRNATDGDRINIKAGTEEILVKTLDYTSWGAPSKPARTIMSGYASTAGDRGQGVISGGGGNFMIENNKAYVGWVDLHLKSTGTANVLELGRWSFATHCEVSDCTADGITTTYNGFIEDCYVHDVDIGIDLFEASDARHCHVEAVTDVAIRTDEGCSVMYCTISVSGAAKGIFILDYEPNRINNNSIFSAGGTGIGIWTQYGSRARLGLFTNNIVEGFSGSGGVGIEFQAGTEDAHIIAGNAVYDCETEYNLCEAGFIDDNETLAQSAFAKTGASTYANRKNWFATLDVGGCKDGAYPSGTGGLGGHKGAVPYNALGGSTGFYYLTHFVVDTTLDDLGDDDAMSNIVPEINEVGASAWSNLAGSGWKLMDCRAYSPASGAGSYGGLTINATGFDLTKSDFRCFFYPYCSTTAYRNGLMFRLNTSDESFYLVWVGNTTLSLYWCNGSLSQIATTGTGAFPDAKSVLFEIEVKGTSFSAYYDGSLILSHTMTNGNDNYTNVGLYSNSSNAALQAMLAFAPPGSSFSGLYPPLTVGRQPPIPHPLAFS